VYEPIRDKLERWIEDVGKSGFEVTQKIITNESPSEIRTLLRGMPSLIGCLMVGDIPYVLYEFHDGWYDGNGVWRPDEFPTDLYYMDLDGKWTDADNDGLFDGHKGDIAPEIWVARLKPPSLYGDSTELLRNYFDKNHLYRIGALTLPNRALIFTDHYLDYYTYEFTPETVSALKTVYPDVVKVAYPERTNASDYVDQLQRGYSLVRLFVHGWSQGHAFGNRTDGTVESEDIRKVDPKVFFYVISSCMNFDHRDTDYIGGWYVFSESYGLLAVGDSGVHDMFAVLPSGFFPRLRSEYFGLAYLRYLQTCVRENARVGSIYNAIVVGDPLLSVAYNGPDSDFDGLSDQYESEAGTDLTKPDGDGDGMTDYRELKAGTSPSNSDTDGDGVRDGQDPHPLDSMPEKASKLASAAEYAVWKAEQQGRTEGLAPAREKLQEAKRAFASGAYDSAISLAQEATELAEKTRMPETRTTVTTSIATMMTPLDRLQTDWPYVMLAAIVLLVTGTVLLNRKRMRK